MPTSLLIPALLALIAGALTAIQSPTNAMLSRAGGSVLVAALISFSVGTGLLAVLFAISRPQVDLAALRALPPYAWVGGLYGAFFVAVAAYAAPRLGVASLVTITIAGQIVAALLIDRTGAFGVPQAGLSAARLAGAGLVLAGVVLVRRG